MIEQVETDDYMTPHQAAESLGVHIESVRKAILRGSLPTVPDPHHPRFRLIAKSDVEKFRARTQPNGVKQRGRPPKEAPNKPEGTTG